MQNVKKRAEMQRGTKKNWFKVKTNKMRNPVALWSENGSDATGIRKQVVRKLKQLK